MNSKQTTIYVLQLLCFFLGILLVTMTADVRNNDVYLQRQPMIAPKTNRSDLHTNRETDLKVWGFRTLTAPALHTTMVKLSLPAPPF